MSWSQKTKVIFKTKDILILKEGGGRRKKKNDTQKKRKTGARYTII